MAGVGFNEDGKTFAGMGVDFADYDNDGRPDIFVTDLSNERYRLFRHERRRQLPRRHATHRRRRDHAAVLGLEHALLRLRQRRLEGHLRRPGTRDGHDREDLAQPEVSAAAAAAAQRRAAGSSRVDGRRRLSERLGRPRCGIRRSRQRRRHRRRRQQRRPEGHACCATTAATEQNWLAIRTVGTTIEPRRDRLPRAGSCPRRACTQHFTINTAAGYLSASDKRLLVGLGGDAIGEARRDPMAVGRRPDVRERQGRQTLVATEPRPRRRAGSAAR